MDRLLAVVEALREACPPDPKSAGSENRDTTVGAALQLAAALREAPPLLPLQLDVLLRQTTHLLVTVRGWDESGTTEAALAAALCCVRRLLRLRLQGGDELGQRSCLGAHLASRQARPVTCELLSTLLVAASEQRAAHLRAACVRAVWSLLLLPLAPDLVAFALPGAATQLVEIGARSVSSHAPTCLAALGAVRTLLLAALGARGKTAERLSLLGPGAAASPADGRRALASMAARHRPAPQQGEAAAPSVPSAATAAPFSTDPTDPVRVLDTLP